MKKKMIAFAVAALICVTGVGSTTIYAETSELVDSNASDANDTSQGSDETQGVKTEYEQLDSIKSTTYEGNESVTVYATKTSYVKVTIPRVLVLGKSDTEGDSTYTGSFKIKVVADIAGCQSVVLTPTVSNNIAEVDGKEVATESTVLIDGKDSITIGANELLNGTVYSAIGTVTVKNITAGSWKGALNFNIEVIQNE